MNKKLFQLYLNPEEYEWVKMRSKKLNKSMAAIVRRVIQEKMIK